LASFCQNVGAFFVAVKAHNVLTIGGAADRDADAWYRSTENGAEVDIERLNRNSSRRQGNFDSSGAENELSKAIAAS
jgi:hypothetical protein